MKNMLLAGLLGWLLFALSSIAFAQTQPACEGITEYPLRSTGVIRIKQQWETPVGPPSNGDPIEPIGNTTPGDSAPERIIHFLHGFRGTKATWALVAEETNNIVSPTLPQPQGYPARKAAVTLPTFAGADVSLQVDANQLVQPQLYADSRMFITNNPSIDTTRNFLIAKSLGGLVARQLNQIYLKNPNTIPRQFYGLVTISTPHRGAPIVGNRTLLAEFSNEACLELGAGPLLSTPLSNNLIGMAQGIDLISTSAFTDIGSAICNMVGDKFIPSLTDKILSPTMDSIAPNSLQLNKLNALDSVYGATSAAIPRVSFYGVEDDKEMWREFYHLVHSPTSDPVFGSDDDDDMMQMADNMMQHYWDEHVYYEDEAKKTQVNLNIAIGSAILLPLPGAIAIIYYTHKKDTELDQAAAWLRGREWLNTANERYLLVNGGATIQMDTVYTCNCWREKYGVLPPKIVAGPNAACTPALPGDECEIFMRVKSTYVHHDNDGMVPAWSTGNYPGLNILQQIKVNNQYYTQQYPGDTTVPQGSNHEQINNSSNTKKMMNDLLRGKIHKFFETTEF